MKAWIEQSECIGNGVCVEIAPDAIVMIDSIAYMRENGTVFAASMGNRQGSEGLAAIPADLEDLVLDAADECPAECIHIIE